MKIDYSVKVDIGIKETNDDRALVSQDIVNMAIENGVCETPCMAIVCDGCGGYAGGDIAAQTVLEVFQGEKAEHLLDVNYLADILQKCKKVVYDKKNEFPQYSAMCTTIAGCIFGDESTIIFHAGDSRVYRFDGMYLAQMTVDHSAVQGMVEMGKITEAEALVNPNRNVINRCIGIECQPPDIYVSHIPISPGEKYIICSDGLWESVGSEKMIEILSSNSDLSDMTNELISCALENGSEDNISVCICSRQGERTVTEKKPFVLD